MPFFTADQLSQLSQSTVRMDFLVKLEFVSQTVYLWNGEIPLTTGGNTYTPLHGIGTIEGLQQSMGSDSQQITMTLNGIPGQSPDILSLALEETPEANQQFCTIMIQLFDNDWQPVGDPVTIWWGFMQPPRVALSPSDDPDMGATQTLSITAENAFFNRSRPSYGWNTDRDQQRRFPGDTFYEFTPSLVQKVFVYPDY